MKYLFLAVPYIAVQKYPSNYYLLKRRRRKNTRINDNRENEFTTTKTQTVNGIVWIII